MLMVIFMRANGHLTRQMEKASIFTLMVLFMKGTGSMTNRVVLVLRFGQTEQGMRVTISMEKRKAKAH